MSLTRGDSKVWELPAQVELQVNSRQLTGIGYAMLRQICLKACLITCLNHTNAEELACHIRD